MNPTSSYEELEIRTRDGVSLRAVVEEPPSGTPFRGTCVFAHALLSRKTTFGRRQKPGLAQAYALKGWRTIAFDFRGHGQSRESARIELWGYDDLVRCDLPAVVECARAHGEDKPVVVVGHSLGGHVALASQGAGYLQADAIVAIAASVWIREFEPSLARLSAKRGLLRLMREVVGRVGYLPARALKLSSDDASARFAGDVSRFMLDDRWASADGADDYLASLSRVRVPVCVVASEGDRFVCTPASAARVAYRCQGPVHFVRIRRSDNGSRAPGHMAIVTTPRAHSYLLGALDWIEGRVNDLQ